MISLRDTPGNAITNSDKNHVRKLYSDGGSGADAGLSRNPVDPSASEQRSAYPKEAESAIFGFR